MIFPTVFSLASSGIVSAKSFPCTKNGFDIIKVFLNNFFCAINAATSVSSSVRDLFQLLWPLVLVDQTCHLLFSQ